MNRAIGDGRQYCPTCKWSDGPHKENGVNIVSTHTPQEGVTIVGGGAR